MFINNLPTVVTWQPSGTLVLSGQVSEAMGVLGATLLCQPVFCVPGILDQLVELSWTTPVSTSRRTGVERSPTPVQQLGTHYLAVLRTLTFRYLLLYVVSRPSSSFPTSTLQRVLGASQKRATVVMLRYAPAISSSVLLGVPANTRREILMAAACI